jgi:hypothetical protein
MGRQEKMSKREKVFPQAGRETAKTEFVGRKMCSHRQAGNK